jgi:hypothetical protein
MNCTGALGGSAHAVEVDMLRLIVPMLLRSPAARARTSYNGEIMMARRKEVKAQFPAFVCPDRRSGSDRAWCPFCGVRGSRLDLRSATSLDCMLLLCDSLHGMAQRHMINSPTSIIDNTSDRSIGPYDIRFKLVFQFLIYKASF